MTEETKPFTEWWYTQLKAKCGFICSMVNDYEDETYKRYANLRNYIIKRRKLTKES